MARDRGPTEKISRRYGVPLFGPSKALERRAYPPGQHGPKSMRKKRSDYSLALAEKQKLRLQYGILEKQFRRYFSEANRRDGVTGTILLQLLEQRLDNVAYRMGFGSTRRASRQFVGHGHLEINGRRVDVASYCVKPGDVLQVRSSQRSQQLAMRLLDLTQATPLPEWVELDREKLSGTFVRIPSREELDPMVNEQLIVEFYSR